MIKLKNPIIPNGLLLMNLALKRKEILLAQGRRKMSEAKKDALIAKKEGLSTIDKPSELRINFSIKSL